MHRLPYSGSTSEFFSHRPGVVLKAPRQVWQGNPQHESLTVENEKAIMIERQILERLGSHERIIPYLNPQGKGLLLAEARHGSLQDYLDSNHAALSWTQRWTICEEICEAIVHIHGKDVVHSHLRPENILVHAVDGSNTHIWLTDFGGSTCPSLGLDGGHLPDTPFFDPRSEWKSTPATDIFSLGSIFYIVLTGHWPFLDGPLDPKDRVSYEEMVEQSFYNGLFPHDLDCEDEKVVIGCWQHKLETAEQVSEAVRDLRGLKYSGVTA